MMNNRQMVSYLDAYKSSHDIDQLKKTFYSLGEKDRKRAAAQLNDPNLTFPTFYTLLPEIDTLDLYPLLNLRNTTACKVCSKALRNEVLAEHLNTASQATNEQNYHVLKWMFNTGWREDGFSNQFDQVLDVTTALLIKKYKDQSILPTVVNEIFERNRKGYYIHDLVWCFYETRNPYALKLAARYLRSNNPEDVKLASELLHYTSEEEEEIHGNPERKYESYLNWFQENQPYLYFTGENLQCSSEPRAFKVDLDAKYLSKKRLSASQKKPYSLTKFEQEKLEQFHQTKDSDRKLLAKYSKQIYSKNPQQWKEWMHADINQQVKYAKGQGREAQ